MGLLTEEEQPAAVTTDKVAVCGPGVKFTIAELDAAEFGVPDGKVQFRVTIGSAAEAVD